VLVYAQFVHSSFTLGDQSGGVQLVHEEHLLLAWGFIFDTKIDKSDPVFVCIFSILTGG